MTAFLEIESLNWCRCPYINALYLCHL